MTGTVLERFYLLLAGQLPAAECGVLVSEPAAGADGSGCRC